MSFCACDVEVLVVSAQISFLAKSNMLTRTYSRLSSQVRNNRHSRGAQSTHLDVCYRMMCMWSHQNPSLLSSIDQNRLLSLHVLTFGRWMTARKGRYVLTRTLFESMHRGASIEHHVSACCAMAAEKHGKMGATLLGPKDTFCNFVVSAPYSTQISA